ncbi:MAG: glycosyltransferase family 4 protein [Gemmataceae bacterium]
MPDPAAPKAIALYYDDDAYVELVQGSPEQKAVGRPMGLMGRQVAGKAFLDAMLVHTRVEELVGLTFNDPSAKSFAASCRSAPCPAAPKRRFRVVDGRRFFREFAPAPPASVLHVPEPAGARFAWARRHAAPGRFCLSGVTHTLSSTRAVDQLRDLMLAPFEPYDTLICTSRAVVRMVRAVTDTFADYLRDRFGGTPTLRPRLAMIPLGVDTDRYRPARPEERSAIRTTLGIADDEVVVLFVGRLSFHAKAHPFPLFAGLERATRATGKKVRLLCAGWAANDATKKVFVDGVQAFAPTVRTDFVDGTRADLRFAVWHAADVFASPSDNIQETFGLVMIEAMAAGLPVVATDWDGYRDLVVHGETGFLAPTTMVRGATRDATAQHLMGELNYDHYLATCNQGTTVDIAATADAFSRLLVDAGLRRQMGEAGRRRVLARFDWRHVVRAYEDLWQEMDAERLARAAEPPAAGPAIYPAPEQTFASYPTTWLDDADTVEATPGAVERLRQILASSLCNYVPGNRSTDVNVLSELLAAAATACPVADLDTICQRAGCGPTSSRASVAWLLKYDLLVATHTPDVVPVSD